MYAWIISKRNSTDCWSCVGIFCNVLFVKAFVKNNKKRYWILLSPLSLFLSLSISLSLPPTLLILLSSSFSNVFAPTETVTSLPFLSPCFSHVSPHCHCIVSLSPHLQMFLNLLAMPKMISEFSVDWFKRRDLMSGDSKCSLHLCLPSRFLFCVSLCIRCTECTQINTKKAHTPPLSSASLLFSPLPTHHVSLSLSLTHAEIPACLSPVCVFSLWLQGWLAYNEVCRREQVKKKDEQEASGFWLVKPPPPPHVHLHTHTFGPPNACISIPPTTPARIAQHIHTCTHSLSLIQVHSLYIKRTIWTAVKPQCDQ